MRANCSGMTLHFLVFMDNTGQNIPQEWYSYLFYSIEFIVLNLNILLAFLLFYLLLAAKVLHFNLTCLISFFALVQIPAHFGRIISIYYEITVGIQTGNCNGMMIYSTLSQLIYIHLICHSSFSFTSERLFALYYIHDYEKKIRPWIPLIFISSTFLTASLFAVDNLYNGGRLISYTVYILGLIFVTSIIIFLTYLWNKRILRKLEENPNSNYSLSKRYQLTENIKLFKLAQNTMVVIGALLVLVCCIALCLAFQGWTPIGVMFFELAKSSCPFIVMLTAFYSIEKWRIIIFKWLNLKTTTTVVGVTQSEETTHFEQLQLQWK